jgi:hypothetical protein
VKALASLLLSRFMITTKEELEAWEDNPECYVLEELRGDWQGNIKVQMKLLLYS